jgi:hypothetical protein
MDVFFSTVLVKLVSTANSRNDSKWIKQQRQFLHKKISKAGFFRDSVKGCVDRLPALYQEHFGHMLSS